MKTRDLPTLQDGLIARSPAMQELLTVVRRVAPSPISVVLLGETGCGKEVLAQALHAASGRTGQFVALNCAALPANLAESELFGHTKGAFTGACADRKGLFEQASGGTILLDEVGELDLSLQGKLLRVLENGEVRPIGAPRSISTDCRVVAATNRDLTNLIEAGQFREDLYHRLAGVVLTVPPLRDRPEDIPPLLERFLVEVAEDRPPPKLAPGTLEALCRRRWSGNVRELRQVTWRAVVLGGSVLSARDFQPLRATRESTELVAEWLRGKRFKDIEREVYAHVLAEVGSVRAAADVLGIPHSTFADRVHQLKLTVLNRLVRSRPEHGRPSPAPTPPAPDAAPAASPDEPQP